jgi:tRNA pseudouridine32 synthase / 23S rRNA pseudouridine746 synthase
MPLEVIYEDEWIIALAKPPGLLSVPGRGEDKIDSVLTRLAQIRPTASGPLLVHRLDQDTSGVILAGKTKEAYVTLQKQFRDHLISKRYVALVQGPVSGDEGTIELPIRLDVEDRPRQIFDPVYGKSAITHWRVLERKQDLLRLQMSPVTGRTHQLRVHAAHPLGLASPIVGDRLYGTKGERLMLHALDLSFAHPQTQAQMTITCPCPF